MRYWYSRFPQVTYLTMSDFDQTSSGIPVKPVYGPQDRGQEPPDPGRFPFTRGNYPNGYRGRLWTFRQYSGFGTPETTPASSRSGFGWVIRLTATVTTASATNAMIAP